MTQKTINPSPLLNLIELVLILFIGFGFFWYSDYLALTSPPILVHEFTTELFVELAVLEVFLFILIVIILKWRGWNAKDFSLRFTFSMFGIGLLLVGLRLSIGHIIESILASFGISAINEYQLSAGLISVILVLIINSIYEEFLLLGYLFKRLEALHPMLIILISMLIRESYHLYQGWEKVPMAISIGIVFGWYYYKYKKLWPPIIAHAMGNGLAFLALHYGWSWV